MDHIGFDQKVVVVEDQEGRRKDNFGALSAIHVKWSTGYSHPRILAAKWN
jgi:hypothetical protein